MRIKRLSRWYAFELTLKFNAYSWFFIVWAGILVGFFMWQQGNHHGHGYEWNKILDPAGMLWSTTALLFTIVATGWKSFTKYLVWLLLLSYVFIVFRHWEPYGHHPLELWSQTKMIATTAIFVVSLLLAWVIRGMKKLKERLYPLGEN